MARERELWVDIRGYTGLYQVSSWGRVRGLPRIVSKINGCTRSVAGKMLALCNHPRGYVIVDLNKDGIGVSKTVHRLVAKAFSGNPNHHKYVNHLDGNKKNNYYKNLAWSSASDNMLHSYATGLRMKVGLGF